MRLTARLSSGYVVSGLLVAIAASSPLELAAQGGRGAVRPFEQPRSAAPEASRLAPARSLLHTLVGSWHFEVRFAGNLEGAPDASGTRILKPLFDDLRLEWTETLDHSDGQARGVLGFDPESGQFFSAALYSTGSAPEFTRGTLDDAEPVVTFRALTLAATPSPGAGPGSLAGFRLTLVDQDHFMLAPLDRAWRAVFTRQP